MPIFESIDLNIANKKAKQYRQKQLSIDYLMDKTKDFTYIIRLIG